MRNLLRGCTWGDGKVWEVWEDKEDKEEKEMGRWEGVGRGDKVENRLLTTVNCQLSTVNRQLPTHNS